MMEFLLKILLVLTRLFEQIIGVIPSYMNNLELILNKSIFLPIFLFLALLGFSLFFSILIEKIYKNTRCYFLINFVTHVNKLSITFALLLSIAYFFLFFDKFIIREEAHLVLLPIVGLAFIFIFHEDFDRYVPILVKSRLKFAFTLLSLSFLNSFVLPFEIENLLQNLQPNSTLEEPNFEIACYGAVLYFLNGFFSLSFGEQVSISVILLLFLKKLVLVPEIADLLIITMNTEENPELATMNPLPLIKPLIEKIPPINNSVDLLSQRTALNIKRESLLCPWREQFEKAMLNGLEKDYKVIKNEKGKYIIKKYAFSRLFDFDNKTKEVIRIKPENLTSWNPDKVEEIEYIFSKIKHEIGEDSMKKLFLQHCVLRNNDTAPQVRQLLGLNTDENLKEVLLPKTRAFIGLNVVKQGLTDHVLKISISETDTAKGLGNLNGPGYAESLPEDSSCAHTVQKLLQTIHPFGRLVGGGVEGKGDFVIEEGGKKYFYEQKDLSIHKINDEKQFNKNFQTRVLIEMKKTTGILIYKAPFLIEEDAPIVIYNLQRIATFSRRTILFFFQGQVTPINPKIVE